MGPEPSDPATVRTRRRPFRAFAVATTIWLVLSTVIPSGTLGAPACSLVPQLREVTINQGLGSYPNLVQGKETLVRAYLSLPSCASSTSAIRMRGGTLTVSGGGITNVVPAPNPAQVSPFPLISPFYKTTPPVDSPGDPKFVVPGSYLDPAGSAGFAATFSLSINYEFSTNGTSFTVASQPVTFTKFPGTSTNIGKTVERETNPLRILVVPVGNASLSYASQYSAAANEQVQLAMQTISRVFPVADGTGELNATSGGVRYTVLPTLIDIKSVLDADGLYCLRGSSFDVPIKGQLQTFAQEWETENPGIQIDVAVAVIDPAISKGGTCAQGLAVMGSTYTASAGLAVARMVPDQGGATLAMEIAHALGMVPSGRGRAGDPAHSPVTAADAGTNRGYNIRNRSFLADDRTALYNSGTGFTNTSTLLEQLDYRFLVCALGGATTSDCTSPGLVGNDVPSGPRFVMSGTIAPDGLSIDELVVAYSSDVPGTPPGTGGPFTLQQINIPASGSSQVIRTDFVPVSFGGTHHGDGPHTAGVVDVAIPLDADADRIEFRNGSTLLRAFEASEVPELTSFEVIASGDSNYTESSVYDDSPAVSPDGEWVAWTEEPSEADSRLLVGPIADSTAAEEVCCGDEEFESQSHWEPAWRGDGGALAFVANGDVYMVDVDTSSGAPEFSNLTLISAYDDIDNAGLYAGHPTWSPDGSQIAFDADGAIFLIDATEDATGTETQLTFTGDASNPSWSQTDGDNRIAYQRTPPSDSASATLMSAVRPEDSRAGVASHGEPETWESHGPEGATVAAIVVDHTTATTVYAGTVGGAGVFKSTDGGGSWARSSSGLPERDVFALVMDTSDPSVLYAGLERGGSAGTVWKSANAGATWSSISDAALGAVDVSALAVDPIDPSILYAGTRGGGVFRSDDGGATWTGNTMGIASPVVNALAIHPTVSSTLYAATLQNGIMKSVDGGTSWTPANTGITATWTEAVVIDPATPDIVYAGASNGVYRSTDAGANWTLTPLTQFIHSLAIEPTDPDALYAGIASQGLYRTSDGGASWEVANTGLLGYNVVISLAVDPSTPGTVYAGQSNAGVFRTANGADTWTEVNSGLLAWHAWAVAIDPSTPSTVYTSKGSHGRAVYRSTDSGESWAPAASGLPEFNDTRILLIDPATPTTLYAVSSGLYKSTNSGGAWVPITGATSGVISLALSPSSPSILYAGNTTGTVYRSINGGGSWAPTASALPGTVIQALAVDPTDADTLLAVGSSTVHRSVDGGGSWTQVYNAGGPCLGPSWSYSLADASIVYGTLTCNKQVAVSADGGATWSLQLVDSGLGSDGIYAVAADPTAADTIYAGQRDGGVHKSTDGGATWAALTTTGMVVRNIRGLAVNPDSPTVIYAATLGGSVYRLEQAVVDPPTLTVNTSDDDDDSACTVAHCSLREAINAANASPNGAVPDLIDFAVGTGPITIQPLSPLPTISDPVVINGFGQPGAFPDPEPPHVEIDGSLAGAAAYGLTVSAGDSVIQGLVINRFARTGIRLDVAGGNVLRGNYIGTDLTGSIDRGNAENGIEAFDSPANTIGGAGSIPGEPNASSGNLISGNDGAGIYVGLGVEAADNVILGNFIGVDVTGTSALGNGADGVVSSAPGTVIGGTQPGERNLISANQLGIYIGLNSGSDVNDNVIEGNYVGTDATGTQDLGNTAGGVALAGLYSGNRVGGTAAGAGNVISGNDGPGVAIQNQTLAVVQGNQIGVGPDGTVPDSGSIGNTGRGVYIRAGADETLVGGSVAGASNTIADNLYGVVLEAAGDSFIEGNRIGVEGDGQTAAGNTFAGVQVTSFSGKTRIGLGLDASGAPNIIGSNGGDGVEIGNSTGIDVIGNSILDNAGLGIDILPDGPNANDPLDGDLGANDLINHPIVTSAASDGSSTTVEGSIEAEPATVARLDVYASDGCDEGATYLGTTTIVADETDGTGSWSLPVASDESGKQITATMSDNFGNTSEFSPCVLVTTDAESFTVNDSDDHDDGACTVTDCTLREAILRANATAGTDTISFDIPGIATPAAPHLLGLESPLPPIDDAVVIDASTEPDFDTATDAPVVQLDGSGVSDAPTYGLDLAAGGSTIRGLAVTNFRDVGIRIESDGNALEGNYIGLEPDGVTAAPNGWGPDGGYGVAVFDASSNAIGRADGIETLETNRNVISGNAGPGVIIDGATATNNTVHNNHIGTNATGTAAVPNGVTGVVVSIAEGNSIGGTDPGTGNLISGNAGDGVTIFGNADSGGTNSVQQNRIGTNAAGTAAVPNDGPLPTDGRGILIVNSPINVIGGDDVGNLISGNATDGVEIQGALSAANSVTDNIIGLSAAGTAAIPNGGAGVVILDPVDGTAVGPDNVISGNGGAGVEIQSTNPTDIFGNHIGTNEDGDSGLGNAGAGIHLNGSASTTVGADTGEGSLNGNVISGNGGDGILVDNGSTGNDILTNLIGLTYVDESYEVLGNAGYGVAILDATGTRIGSDAVGEGNFIGGNADSGIGLASATGTTIEGNGIGTGASGVSDFGNGGDGVTAVNVPDAVIGGLTPGSANTIAFNGGNGVAVDVDSTGVLIRGNSIDQNGELGIDLDIEGPTGNDIGFEGDSDTDTGANGLQNYPYLGVNGDGSLITGNLISSPDTDFEVDLFVSPDCDPSDNGEGAAFIGSVAASTNQFGYGVFDYEPSSPVGATEVVTGTATGPEGTSEFSFCAQSTPTDVEVWTLDPSDPADSQVQLVEDAAQPSWGSGGQVAFARDGNIHTIRSDKTGETQLTDSGVDSSPSLGGVTAFVRFVDDFDGGGQDDVFLLLNQFNVLVTANDDHPELVRLDLIYSCPGSPNYDVAVGLVPQVVTTTSARWAANFDPSLACPNGTLRPVLTDFWNRTAPTGFDEQITSEPQAPVAAIYVPEVGDSLLQWDALALHGSGKDADDGELLGSSLRWFVDGVEVGYGACGSTRSHCDIQPPGGAWSLPTGQNSRPLTVRLEATDSDGETHSDDVTITVLRDTDEDGMPATVEVACGLSDTNPRDAFADRDGDLYLNQDDYALGGSPCVAATSYPANVVFSPDTLYIPSSGAAVTMTVRLPLRDIKTIRANTVKLQLLSGEVVAISNTGWTVDKSGLGTARFDRQIVIQKLQQLGMTNTTVHYTVVGTSSQGWSFEGTDTAVAKPAN